MRSSFAGGAICQFYEKTASLTTLRQVIGHSSIQVSLTYLRALEVSALKSEDMPELKEWGRFSLLTLILL